MTLSDLEALIQKHRDRDVIMVSAEEWAELTDWIMPQQVVAATSDQPAFFWFRDKKIVTPQYVTASEKVKREWEAVLSEAKAQRAI